MNMLKRLSVNVLLKSVIATLGIAIVVMLSLSAWESWKRLGAENRIAAVANASAYMFTAMHNLRVDRSSTFRDLMADKQFTAPSQLVKESREGEMPALDAALGALAAVDIPERQSVIAELDQRIKKLTALQQESAAAFLQPKAAR